MTNDTSTRNLTRRAGWSVFMGLLTFALGAAMILYSSLTAVVSAVLLGWALLFAAVAQFVFAFSSDKAGNFILKVLVAMMYGVAGIALVAFPFAGIVTLTGVIGVMLIVDAILESALALALPGIVNRIWLFAGAASSLLLGILIVRDWPSSAAWAIGTMAGVAVLINGITRVAISGTVIHDVRSSARMTPHHA